MKKIRIGYMAALVMTFYVLATYIAIYDVEPPRPVVDCRMPEDIRRELVRQKWFDENGRWILENKIDHAAHWRWQMEQIRLQRLSPGIAKEDVVR